MSFPQNHSSQGQIRDQSLIVCVGGGGGGCTFSGAEGGSEISLAIKRPLLQGSFITDSPWRVLIHMISKFVLETSSKRKVVK